MRLIELIGWDVVATATVADNASARVRIELQRPQPRMHDVDIPSICSLAIFAVLRYSSHHNGTGWCYVSYLIELDWVDRLDAGLGGWARLELSYPVELNRLDAGLGGWTRLD